MNVDMERFRTAVPLDVHSNNGASSRTKFYVVRDESGPNSENRKYVLTTSPVMA